MTKSNPLRGLRTSALLLALTMAVLSACVTINVYFPAAQVQRAADRLIDEVWGDDAQPAPDTPAANPPANPPANAPANPPPKPNAAREPAPVAQVLLVGLVEWLIPAAHAQANIDVSSPAIDKLKRSMQARHIELAPHYASGGIGLTAGGLVALRDRKSIALRSRQAVTASIAAENRDRKALYREIARANGHPEWEPEVQSIFARRWISKARSGWWYQDGSRWRQK